MQKRDWTAVWSFAIGFVVLVGITALRYSASEATVLALTLLVLGGSLIAFVRLARLLLSAMRLGSMAEAAAATFSKAEAWIYAAIAVATGLVAIVLIPSKLTLLVIGASLGIAVMVGAVGLIAQGIKKGV